MQRFRRAANQRTAFITMRDEARLLAATRVAQRFYRGKVGLYKLHSC